jgi:D-alanyl-D-alanine carboxypeptidase (penicillin-binding protein 5/6)
LVTPIIIREWFLVVKKAAIYIIMVSITISLFGVIVYAQTDSTGTFDLKAKSAILMDAATQNVLFEKNSHEKLPIASITKIMSMILFMEAIDSGRITYEDPVIVSEHSYSMGGSQVWLEPGEEFSVYEMLEAVAISSANDATVALAEKVAGSEDAFVSMMNERAKDLGMNNTNFLDCTGLTDEGHYSSAYDIALMSRELIVGYPEITEFTTKWHELFRENVEGKEPVTLDNTNKLIRTYEGANGLKTGRTEAAGYCLSATAKRGDLLLIAVVLNAPNSSTRFAEAKKLLDYGFANFETTRVNYKNEIIEEVEVRKGLAMRVKAVYPNDVELLVRKGEKDKIEREIILEKSIKAPVTAGQRLGEVIYSVNGEEIGRTEIIAESSVARASFIRLFIRMLLQWFGIGRS